MREIPIHTEYIKLQQALKLADLLGSGGEVKALLVTGAVLVNGQTATERGKKLRPGDRVDYEDEHFVIVAEEP